MTIHQWRRLIGQPPRASRSVFISAACVPALPQYALQDDEGESLLRSVCFSHSPLVLTSPSTSPLFPLITCPLVMSHPFLSALVSPSPTPLPAPLLIDEDINHSHTRHRLSLTWPNLCTVTYPAGILQLNFHGKVDCSSHFRFFFPQLMKKNQK